MAVNLPSNILSDDILQSLQGWGGSGLGSVPFGMGNSSLTGGLTSLGGLGGLGGGGGSGGFNWSNFLLGGKDTPGALQLGLGALGGIGNIYTGMKAYGVAKDNLRAQKDQFERNYAAQRDTINTQYEDRQRARVASNPEAYESVDSYMERNKIR